MASTEPSKNAETMKALRAANRADSQRRASTAEDVMAAAYKHVAAVVPKADGFHPGGTPYWYGWAIREAFCLGAKYQAEVQCNQQKKG